MKIIKPSTSHADTTPMSEDEFSSDDSAVFLEALLRDYVEPPSRHHIGTPLRPKLPMAKASIPVRPITTNRGRVIAPPLLSETPRGSRVFVVLTAVEAEAVTRLMAGDDPHAAAALSKIRMATIASSTV